MFYRYLPKICFIFLTLQIFLANADELEKCKKRLWSLECDINGKAYDSLCDFKIAQSKNPSLQLEKSSCKHPCNRMCPLLFSPVCDQNGRTYANRCNFDIAQCIHPFRKLADCEVGSTASVMWNFPGK